MYRHKEYVSVGDHRLTGEVGGTLWQVGEMSGWWERPGVKRQDLSRELADGDFPTPWHYEPRYISIPGRVKACSHDALHAALDTLNGLASRSRETLSVSGHGRQMSALVQADDSPDISILNHRLADFTLHFKANDPRKLGFEHEVEVGPEPVEVEHCGNYMSYPVLEVWPTAGPLGPRGFTADFRYQDGALRRWWFEFPATGTHRIDFYTGVQLFGETRQPQVRRADSCFVPPGVPVEVSVHDASRPASGGVAGLLRWRDTWI